MKTTPAPAALTIAMPLSAPKLPTIDHAIGLPPGGTAPIDFAARYEADMIARYGSFREDPCMARERELAKREAELANQGHSYLWRTGYDSREEHLADILRDIEGGR